MELVSEGEVLHAGPYNASALAMAAVCASIDLLSEPGTHERLFTRAERLMEVAAGLGIPEPWRLPAAMLVHSISVFFVLILPIGWLIMRRMRKFPPPEPRDPNPRGH